MCSHFKLKLPKRVVTFNLFIIDYTLLEVLKEEPIRVTIKGLRRTFYPPIHHAPIDNTPPDKKMQLEWVYPSL